MGELMPEFDDYDENDDEQGNGAQPADLRKLVKQRDKELKALREQVATFQAEAANRSLSETLKAAGVEDPRAAKLIRADGVDASKPEAVEEWLKTNGDLFGFTGNKDTEASDNIANQWAQQSAALGAGSSGGDSADVLNQVKNASNKEELFKLLRAQGVRI